MSYVITPGDYCCFNQHGLSANRGFMRITNDFYDPSQLLAELLSATRYSPEDTAEFFIEERASHDWLVDRWHHQIDVMLGMYKRYGHDVHGSQSLRDHGVDVRVGFETLDGARRNLGLQIKSNREAEENARRKPKETTLVGTLKQQCQEARSKGSIDEWWIVPCFDAKKFGKLFQTIVSEIPPGTSAFPQRIVSPEQAACFLAMSNDEIIAVCIRLLCKEDAVLREARSEIDDMETLHAYFVLEFLPRALEGERESSQDEVARVWRRITDDEGDMNELASTLSILSDFIEQDDALWFHLKPEIHPALCAVYFETRVRHGRDPDSAAALLSLLVGPNDGDEDDDEDDDD
ncbi:XopAX family type III secretion system effector [Luteibacter sp. 9133]|uniref:XopAX family type III secretion system effector n=1 Tax=Luteibacter sp. 9133 TaxID=1500891 RepID=UPI0005BE9314|nr:XopAX family type III secretion system effector [Luteibacter sp. 9133]